ncbi:acetate kinase [Anaerosalibacter bizertensis]|uniref:Acetate kinase n=2 Tax=Anaerosalibacter bizertensis TaxID=932217 RepID=A0A844FIU3_9FIRM|nr:acetate kinase [Anaerosalibacter bizertensis]MBV1816586.1 acetate kinase [Bacteroidales bacterium MSK.15.36]MCB5558610.1 acetate kinase [Anaerosalibacter bizertensis]MCG4563973.1 acetate kinase [Anaerosalibacter bizertensis]MCG4581793.1 acetate kinase [Anaerosalibacter bizertensis]MSS43880.1 acetate kinase [Anaerosalibacter bizertensis]
MMNILVINCGSSSLKYQLIDMDEEKVLAKGLSERIGIEGSKIKHTTAGKEEVVIEKPMSDHKEVLEIVLKTLVDPAHGAIKSMDEINAVGHRVVHGGEKFANSIKIDDEVMDALNECIDLAPLHNPPNIMGIEACKELMPDTPMVAVFDTAFHQTMPKSNFIYPLPYELYEKYGIRKYGFHGTSHKYVSSKAAEMLDKDIKDLNIVTCHLGNGASICAVEKGKSIDTSMGFTPLAGLAMGTRSGNIDPAIIPFLVEKENLSMEEVNNLLNKESGVLGISGVSSDFRDIEQAAEKGNERAELALDVFVNKVKKYIGAYTVLMGEVDAIVFTAGIGENSVEIREMVCEGLENLGIELDKEKNNVRGKEALVSKDTSKVKVLVIPTNEELMIAKDTQELA